jgi:hypothetical protein
VVSVELHGSIFTTEWLSGPSLGADPDQDIKWTATDTYPAKDRGLYFNGSSAKISHGETANEQLLLLSHTFTYSMWARPDNAQTKQTLMSLNAEKTAGTADSNQAALKFGI